jgi:hypothetical protein
LNPITRLWPPHDHNHDHAAKNGQQYAGSPAYSASHSGYPQQQQPMFIIIPAGGKSGYKHPQPSIYPAAGPSYGAAPDPYESLYSDAPAPSMDASQRAGRRLAPYFRRRSASLLKRKKHADELADAAGRPPPSSALVVHVPPAPKYPALPAGWMVASVARTKFNLGQHGKRRAPGTGARPAPAAFPAKNGVGLWQTGTLATGHRLSSLALARAGSGDKLEDGSSKFIIDGDDEDEGTPASRRQSSGDRDTAASRRQKNDAGRRPAPVQAGAETARRKWHSEQNKVD